MSTEGDLKNLLITSTKANNALVRELKAQTKAITGLSAALNNLAVAIAAVASEDEHAQGPESTGIGGAEVQRYMDGTPIGNDSDRGTRG